MKAIVTILSIVTLGMAGGGYYFFDENAKTREVLEQTEAEVDDLSIQLKNSETEKSELVQELEAKIAAISKEKEEEINKLKGTHDELLKDMEKEIEQGQVKITQMADRLSVTMVDKILFPSGKTKITDAGIEVLERVGNVIKGAEDKIIRVEGHTDNIPITSSRLQELYPTNWELSTARATNVVRLLQEKVGIEPDRLEAVGLSEFHPVASNETPEGRSQNRRIEIALFPRPANKKVLEAE